MTAKQLKAILSLFEDDIVIDKLWTLKRSKQYFLKFKDNQGTLITISGQIKEENKC